MITILHGDHQVASRNRLNDLKSEAKENNHETVTLNGPTIELTDIIQSLESSSLFNENRTVIIENLLSSLKAGEKRDQIVNYLVNAHGAGRAGNDNSNLILWEKGSVGRQLIKLKKAQHVTIEEFKMPVVIFAFVDSFAPNNYTALIASLHAVIEKQVAPELVFAMVVRQFRLLLALQTHADISETKRLAPWQKGKLVKQASLFPLPKLKELYKELLVIDYQTKTGKSAFDLTKRMEQFILNI